MEVQQEGGGTRGWRYKRVEVQEGGGTRGWRYKRVEVQCICSYLNDGPSSLQFMYMS